jgi:hypothetical protein
MAARVHFLLLATGGKIVVADQIYRGRFLFASKNCENNKDNVQISLP